MSVSQWIQKHMPSFSGKTVAISGATGGLGRAIVSHLSALGANFILIDRNLERSKALAKTVLAAHPDCMIDFVTVDMAELSTVKAAAEQLLMMAPDYLVLNAGAYHIPRFVTKEGYDNVFTINCLSPFYLAEMLHDSIAARGGRIVVLGSIAHRYSESDPDDVDFRSRRKSSLVYGNAKRHLMYALDETFGKKGTVVIAHPGITFTNITAHYPKVIFAVIKYPMKVIFMKTKKASLSVLAALIEKGEYRRWIGPSLFDVWGYPKKKRLSDATDEEAARMASAVRSILSKL